MTAAADLVAALEKITPGSAGTPMLAGAQAAFDAEHAAAERVVFSPEIMPVSADEIAAYAHFIAGHHQRGYDVALAGDHLRALPGWPALARRFRSPEALADVAQAAAACCAGPLGTETLGQAQARDAAAAVARYKRAIAAQLASTQGELGDAARTLIALDALAERLEAVRQRFEQAYAADRARAEAEAGAACAAAAAERARKVDEAAAKAEAEAAEAKRALDAAIAARVEALGTKLRTALKKSKSPDQMILVVGWQSFPVEDIVGGDVVPATLDQLAAWEQAVDAGQLEHRSVDR